jgi:hypothetical protein
MRLSYLLCLLINLHLIIQVASVVNYKEYSSDAKPNKSNNFNDLLGIAVECPHRGALKNFAVEANSTYVWYDYSCYSSITNANEFDESILKTVYYTNSVVIRKSISQSVDYLRDLNILCPVDYALSKFVLSRTDENYLSAEYACVGVKSSKQTKSNSATNDQTATGNAKSIEILNDLTCGDTTIESEEAPGTPLRGFKVDVSFSANGDAKVQYLFSMHSLRSIEKEKIYWTKQMESLRKSNTQAN